jgi:hypothetical protein
MDHAHLRSLRQKSFLLFPMQLSTPQIPHTSLTNDTLPFITYLTPISSVRAPTALPPTTAQTLESHTAHQAAAVDHTHDSARWTQNTNLASRQQAAGCSFLVTCLHRMLKQLDLASPTQKYHTRDLRIKPHGVVERTGSMFNSKKQRGRCEKVKLLCTCAYPGGNSIPAPCIPP